HFSWSLLMKISSLHVVIATALLLAGASSVSARHHGHDRHVTRADRVHAAHRSSHHQRVAHRRHVHVAHRAPSASRECLTGETRSLLNRVEATFGPVQVISTCRPGAVIAGTNHASQHRYGKAVDFVAPAGKKAAIVRWLAANNRGGTMTYAHMNHI